MGTAALTFAVKSGVLQELSAKTWIIPVFQPETLPSDETLDKQEDTSKRLPLEGYLQEVAALLPEVDLPLLFEQDAFSAAHGKTYLFRVAKQEGLAAERFLFLGLGKQSKLTNTKLMRAYAGAIKAVSGLHESLRQTSLLLPEAYTHQGGPLASDPEITVSVSAEQIAIAGVDATYEALYKSAESKKAPVAFPEVVLYSKTPAETEAALPLAQALAQGRVLTKDLVNMPANLKTTNTMVEAAKALKEAYPFLELEVIEDTAWIQKEMPSFFAVARGSLASDPPKFIHLRYKGAKPKRKIALIGKSVIFDTGGYQVKPGNFMVTMKGDMAGGASVLGALKVIAQQQPEELLLDVYLAATPNKIDSDAFVPDSIIDSTCGKKIEVRHTDAEGRLTLIDAVAKAQLEEPDLIITVATLTGAAMRAVGRCIALMGKRASHLEAMASAAAYMGEPLQVLDLLPADYENIQSKLDGADIRNTSKSDNRGAQSAGAFVMSGAKEEQPCLHLDIAGADMWSDETSTALSVLSLARFLLQ